MIKQFVTFHRSKQTQAEAVKLKRIQKELQALDDMVSNDIGILRGKIEQASWEYSTARYRDNTRTCGKTGDVKLWQKCLLSFSRYREL